MASDEALNIFVKSRYSLSEEDRVVNGLLLLLSFSPLSFSRSFLHFVGVANSIEQTLNIREHVPYAPESIVDGELAIAGELIIAIEAKIREHQFVNSDQPERYLRLLNEKSERTKVLLLLSPDSTAPVSAISSSADASSCYAIWRSWGDVYRFVERQLASPAHQVEPARFLMTQYLAYLDALGLRARDAEWEANRKKAKPQLHYLLGNVATEKILLHIYHHGGGHVNGIARDHKLGMGGTQRVMERLVRAGLLKRESRGRSVWYTFDDRSELIKPLTEMLRIVYDSIPASMRKADFEPDYVPDK